MKRLLIFSTLLLITSFTTLRSQEKIQNPSKSKNIIKELQSKEGQTYQLLITLPKNYNKEKAYKVLYYLDGWWLSELVIGNYRLNSITNKVNELILVGISLDGDEAAWNDQRNMDYTPSAYDKEKMKISMKGGTYELNEKTTGGAASFLSFLETKVFEEIEGSFKTIKNERGILGHSFGGLFGFYCLTNHPETFKNYLLISPSIWWNKSELLTEENFQKINKTANIYMTMGTAESGMLKKPIRKLIQDFDQLKEKETNIILKEHENLNHHSIVPLGIYEGIEWIYK